MLRSIALVVVIAVDSTAAFRPPISTTTYDRRMIGTYDRPASTLHASTAKRRTALTPASMLLGEQRISFTSNSGESKSVLATIRGLASKLQRWGPDEWKVVGAPPLQFSSRTLSTGVSLVYYKQAEDAGRLSEDGACEVTLVNQGSDGKYDIVFEGRGSRRQRNEDVLYKLLLDAIRQDPTCTLSFGLYPPSSGVAKTVAKIDAACLVNKKGQYSRF